MRLDALWLRYYAQDLFRLDRELPPPRSGDSADLLFLRAASLAAFGENSRSERILREILDRKPLNHGLEVRARELLMLDLRSRFQYAQALDVVRPLLTDPSAELGGLRNRAALLEAVTDIGVQVLRPGRGNSMSADPQGRVHVLFDGGAADMALDTGANFSVMSRSAAHRLGLRIRTADYAITSPLGGLVRAGVAAAKFSFADGTRASNVLFLVLPDRALVLADGHAIDGLIGRPVIAALGPVTFSRDRVRFGAPEAKGAVAALAFGANDPLLRVTYRQQDLLCRLDTGAERSLFFGPFRRQIGGGRVERVRIGSATGTHDIEASDSRPLEISIAGRTITLARPAVLVSEVPGEASSKIACTIGRDMFSHIAGYTVDLRRLMLTLR
jgi:hypothetical protein